MLADVVLVMLVVVVTLLYLGSRKPKGYPPGPIKLPIVGNLFFMRNSKQPHKDLWELSARYGPVVGLYFGSQARVIVNGWEAVKESLLNEDLNGRPAPFFIRANYDGCRGIMFVEGDLWKEQRRFTLHQLRNLGFGKRSHESIVHEEAEDLIDEIKASKGSVSIQDMLGVSNINILWAVMGGERFGRDDKRLWDLVGRIYKMFRSGQIASAASFFRMNKVTSKAVPLFQAILDGYRSVCEFIKVSVKEHRSTLDPAHPRDFIDVYLKELETRQEEDPNSSFNEMQLIGACTDIFSAGTDTVSSTLTFALLLSVLHPEVQTKVQKELDEVVGSSRFPSVEDRDKLVYTNATIHEVLRFRSAVPVVVPHRALRDTVLQGHHIPKGSIILNNAYSVHMDQEYWGDPEVFRPERFIASDGSLRKEERLIPFSKGKRVCLGESLARLTTFTLYSSLLQQFTFTLDPAIPLTELEGVVGFTLSPPKFRVFAERRI